MSVEINRQITPGPSDILGINFNSGGIQAVSSESAEIAADPSLPNLSGEEAREYLKEQGIYESLEDAIQSAKYSIYPCKEHPLGDIEAAYSASNPRQRYSTYFSIKGVMLVSNSKNNKWKIGMNLEHIGHGDCLQAVKSGEIEVKNDKTNIVIDKFRVRSPESRVQNQSEIVEWYKNTSDGLEQGWTINERLSETDSDLRLVLAVKSDLKMKLTSDGQAIDFVRANERKVIRYEKLKSWDADGKELASRMELDGNQLALVVDDNMANYPITVDPLFEQTQIKTASDAAEDDQFGGSVAISGNTAVVGTLGSADQGSAYIFDREKDGPNMWGEVKKLNASDAGASAFFGVSVSISNDTVIVGAYGDNPNNKNYSGSAYIFDRNHGGDNNWGQSAKLIAPDGEAQDYFGHSVAISENRLLVGAYGDHLEESDMGSVYIFELKQNKKGNIWGEAAKLTASDRGRDHYFGYSLAISGDTVIVGATGYDKATVGDCGAAYIFSPNKSNPANWDEVKILTASDGGTGDDFGSSVAISGDTAIVGAPKHGTTAVSNSGAAYTFDRNKGGSNMWGQADKLTASDGGNEDNYFGNSVAISGDTVIVGDYADNQSNKESSGSAYIFDRNKDGTNTWGQADKITASDSAAYDFFGSSVAINENTVIIGASRKDGTASSSGSAYIFEQEKNWSELKKLTASDAADAYNYDVFGYSVAISKDTVIVGATHHDTTAEVTYNDGAAYIFDRNKDGKNMWGQVAILTAQDGGKGDLFGTSVSIDGDTAIVGIYAGRYSKKIGSAYVFERNAGGKEQWGQVKKLIASDSGERETFGRSVAVSGDTAIIGAHGNTHSGSAYIFERHKGGHDGWGQAAKINASDGEKWHWFGVSVAISKDTIIVGSRRRSKNSGAAYIFERDKVNHYQWVQAAKIIASDGSEGDGFGRPVAIIKDTVVVGAHNADDREKRIGSAYIFERNVGGKESWGEVKKLTAYDGVIGAWFAESIAISKDAVIVGAHRMAVGAVALNGSAYIFGRNKGGKDNWGLMKKLIAADNPKPIVFGCAVAISKNSAIVGACEDENGSAYIYTLQD